MHKLIIIGSGPAGLTAAIYSGRANLQPLVIEGRAPGGQLMGTTLVENWPGDKRIMGPQLMSEMRAHAVACGAQFVSDEVVEIVPLPSAHNGCSMFNIKTSSSGDFEAHALIVASGASPKKLHVPGEDTYWGKGVTTCAVCDGALFANKPVVVVGGGDTAMEDALFLTKYTDDITIIQLFDKLTASYAMQQPVLANTKIKILYHQAVKEIIGESGHARQLVVTDQRNGEQTTVEAEGIFIAIGQVPNTKFLKGLINLDEYGYVRLHEAKSDRFSMLTATSVPGIFAAGDVADQRYRQAISSAGSGCMAALDVERYLKKY